MRSQLHYTTKLARSRMDFIGRRSMAIAGSTTYRRSPPAPEYEVHGYPDNLQPSSRVFFVDLQHYRECVLLESTTMTQKLTLLWTWRQADLGTGKHSTVESTLVWFQDLESRALVAFDA